MGWVEFLNGFELSYRRSDSSSLRLKGIRRKMKKKRQERPWSNRQV